MAKQAKPYLGVYENMDFPPYKFEEYPKVVGYRDEKKTDPILVNNPKEEIDFITHGAPGAIKTREDELTDELNKKALELELAKKQLDDLKAAQEALKAKAPEKKV